MMKKRITKSHVTIKFAGDSGDGMQLTGGLFTENTAFTGNDLATFPDYPAEIRAPAGTLAGVSGFQIHFSSEHIFTPGDKYDVLVAMNAAALKANLHKVRLGATLILNEAGFDKKNLRLANYEVQDNPLTDGSLVDYETHIFDITKLTRETLKEFQLSTKEKDRSKNMFVLGFLLWRYSRSLTSVLDFLKKKFAKNEVLLEANINTLKAGYHFGETTETFTTTYEVPPAQLSKGKYRNITGSRGLIYGLIAAARQANLDLFYGSYPITPASDMLHLLAAHKHFGVKTFQAEDEIAAISAAIGAAYGGDLAVTGTSGPGLALKVEAMGLAVMLELPLVIVNVQRGGPSTGLPTKTEQADLLMAVYGRNGESPMPVLAIQSPADAFDTALEACRIALEHVTPVLLLSDGYIANGAEPWKIPEVATLPSIRPNFAEANTTTPYLPYQRNEKLARTWVTPGTADRRHRLGGLEKEALTGNVSYDPANHEYMVKTRAKKIALIADYIPLQTIEGGVAKGDILVLGWGSTAGVITSVVRDMVEEGSSIAYTHLRYIHPFPSNLGEILGNYKKIIVPEINNGQLSQLLQGTFLMEITSYNKIQGVPITKSELRHFILQIKETL